ncbi:hypothetical protein [Alishewanella phage vB_AspM_Slickus01]|nr:hypothetical protein [Alishewanella phage vB_AspM_Slicko01]WGH49724.1 hypothetical protein [Alishewanella phage vB_AspM_Slickus01]
MKSLIVTLAGFVSDNNRRTAQLNEAAAKANNDLYPTIDVNGRSHAPCDGYEWDGEVYNGGEYLSFDGGRSKSSAKAKVKVATAIKEDISKVWSTVSFGKAWTAKGVEVCYAYIEELTESQRVTLENSIVTNRKVMMDEEAAIATGAKFGAVWKFNARKYAKALQYCFDALMSEVSKDGIPHSAWDIKDGKFVCEFKGKMVCYTYQDAVDYFNA